VPRGAHSVSAAETRASLPPLTLSNQCFLFNELLSAPFSRARRREKKKKKEEERFKGTRTQGVSAPKRAQRASELSIAIFLLLCLSVSLSLSLSPSFPRARKFDNASGSSPSYVRREDSLVPWYAFRHAAEWMDTRREHARSRVDEM